MGKTKNEHFVPKSYLKNFTDKNEKIYVFDKLQIKEIPNQTVNSVARQRYFYDVDFGGLIRKGGLSEEKVKEDLGLDNLDILDEQYLENAFNTLENDFAKLLRHIRRIYTLIQEEAYDRALLLNKEQKIRLSICLAYQFIRTKEFREHIIQIYEKGSKSIIDSFIMQKYENYNPNLFELKLDEDILPLLHSSFLVDEKLVDRIASALYNHIWIFGVNTTSNPFYTSDNPIVKQGVGMKTFYSNNSFYSKGVEVAFPINSKLILIMADREMYNSMSMFDNKFKRINDEKQISYYNSLQVYQSYRQIFCCQNDFDFARKLCEKNPSVSLEHRRRVSVQ